MFELYKAIAGSPITYLAADISANQTTISIADDSALPDGPNICTIGYGENLETIKYETKSNGVLQNVTRGIEGTPRAWPAGTEVARFFTAYDYNALIENFNSHLETGASDDVHGLADKVIIETGNNANGQYIKFGDGTMICYGSISKILSIDIAFGSLFRNDNDTLVITYPVSFYETAPALNVFNNGSTTVFFANQTTGTASEARLYALRPAAFTDSNIRLNWCAIGRWK